MHTASYEYDRLGRLVAHIDPAGHRTAYELDRDGKPLKRIDARGGVLEYRYDTARRIAQLINENGDVHRFVYDELDRLAEETSFDARLTRYRYDGSGLLVGKEELGCTPRTEYTPIATTYVRDGLGQLVEKEISRVTGIAQAQQLRLRFAYDALGRMIQAINADATVTMAYDALGQLVSEQTEASGSTSLLRHACDELGNRVQTILPDGRVLNNLYYGSGHLHQINLDGELITDIERDRAHRMISRTQGAGQPVPIRPGGAAAVADCRCADGRRRGDARHRAQIRVR
ncbi:RHS repeat protein [Pseudoduganella armeniaca]|uniref:RHS repeat protein n=1 Tax=Pseudoduganella armeniaca TaxID=2072590 RepID=UPI0015E7D70C|nr:RHS repeat protein [Pseudoduganella armeniaca]